MDNFSKRRNNKKANAWITVICASAIFIVFNVMLKTLEEKIQLSFDMTPNKLFVLSDETNAYLENLSEEVRMYYLIEPGSESPYVTEVIDRFEKKSDKITIEKVDPVKNPAFVSKYAADGEAIQKGTVIVESDKRYTPVDPGSALTIIRDKNGNVSRSLGFSLEQKLTNAIDFTVRGKNVTVRYSDGHGGIPFSLPASKLRAENIDVRKTVLSDEEITAENTDLLVLFGFMEDLSEAEAEKVREYLKDGGNLFITLDPGARPANILKIAEDYGIIVEDNILSEGNKGEVVGGNELYLMAVSEEHKICENLKQANILFSSASSLSIAEKGGISTSYLMKTKDSAKSNELINGEMGRSLNSGSFGVAAMGENDYSRVFVASSSRFLVPDDSKIDNILNVVDYQNREFFVQTVKYMTDSENLLVPVAAKSIDSRNLILSNNKKFVYIILFGGILPLAVFVFGLVLWLKRRNL
ncbi:MAG: Gldg family protein [Clostridia bacterium]|nr:Gldg family protein [Clostridia bacterium]